MMTKTIKAVVIGLIFCTFEAAYSEERQLDQIKTSCVAVSYRSIQDKIFLGEVLYKGFWLETKNTAKDYSGSWSADPDLLRWLVTSLSDQGFAAAKSVYELSSQKAIDAYQEEMSQRVKDFPDAVKDKFKPAFLEAYIKEDMSPALQAMASEVSSGLCNYLLEFVANGISALRVRTTRVSISPYIRLIDVKSGSVLWSAKAQMTHRYDSEVDLAMLEENDMEKAKAGLREAIYKFRFEELTVAANK